MSNHTAFNEGVAWLCTYIASAGISNGQLATLRKEKKSGVSPVVWWLLAQVETKKLQRQLSTHEQGLWIELIHALAIMTPTGSMYNRKHDQESPTETNKVEFQTIRANPHAPEIPLGRALFLAGKPDAQVAGYSELRLATLLAARNEQKKVSISRMCRFLTAKQQRFNCNELADLIFTTDTMSKKYDFIRQQIAAAYYRTATRASTSPELTEVNT